MKNLLKISILVVVLAACSKNKEITTSVPQQRTMDKTDCSKFLPVDVSKIAAKRPIKGGQNQKVTATAIASYFTGKATVSLSFNIKSTPIVINRRRVADGVTVHLYTSQKRITHYNDDNADASTSYIYIVNGVESNLVTTMDAPVIGGTGETPVVYLNPDGGQVTQWGTWVSYVGPTAQEGINEVRDMYDTEIGKKYGFNFIVTTDSNVYKATHYSRRVQIFITDDYTWYGNMAGGVAYVGSFGLETPAFVFPPLLYYNLNYVKFATGHEGLHTKGLYHAKDSCNQSYGTTANWMGGNYNFTPEQRFIGESVLSGTAQGCMLINQILTVRNTIN